MLWFVAEVDIVADGSFDIVAVGVILLGCKNFWGRRGGTESGETGRILERDRLGVKEWS